MRPSGRGLESLALDWHFAVGIANCTSDVKLLLQLSSRTSLTRNVLGKSRLVVVIGASVHIASNVLQRLLVKQIIFH